LLEMAEAAIRVRFHLHVDGSGNLRVAGYHVNDSSEYKDRVPVAHAERVGENFEVVVDDDFTLVWYPDDSGPRPVVSAEYLADSGTDPYSILVTPIQKGCQEYSAPSYRRPFEDQAELIVSFPADSGIEPLYLVSQKIADREDAPIMGNREPIEGAPALKSQLSQRHIRDTVGLDTVVAGPNGHGESMGAMYGKVYNSEGNQLTGVDNQTVEAFNDAYRQAERTRGFRAEGYNMVVQDVAMGIAAGPIIGLAAGASGKMAAPLIGKGKGALGSLRNTDVPGSTGQ